MPFSSELPTDGEYGSQLARSSMPTAIPLNGAWIPSQGCAVDMDPQAALDGIDTILDFAVKTLLSQN